MKVNNNPLKIADKIVDERQSEYGDAVKTWNMIAISVSAITGKDITTKDCLTVLKVMKQVREYQKHKDDNLIDQAGYIKIESMIDD